MKECQEPMVVLWASFSHPGDRKEKEIKKKVIIRIVSYDNFSAKPLLSGYIRIISCGNFARKTYFCGENFITFQLSLV
jgi:hypothetical protein